MISYSASDLRERATIKSVSSATDENFEEVATLAEVQTLWCMFAPQAGRETMRADQLRAEGRALLVTRYRSWITTNHIIQVRGVIYEIHDVIDVEGRRRFQELVVSVKPNPHHTGDGEGPSEGDGEGEETYPAFESKTAAVATSDATSLAIDYPANISAGDDLFLLVAVDQDDANGTTVPGFNLLTGAEIFADAGSQSIYAALFHKIATGSETGSVTITLGNSAEDTISAAMVRVSGGDEDATPLVSASEEGATTAPAAPGSVLESEKYLLFDMWAVDGNANFYDSDPSGFTNRHNSGSEGTGLSLSIASKQQDGDGATTYGDEAHTITGARQAIAFSLAIKGAA